MWRTLAKAIKLEMERNGYEKEVESMGHGGLRKEKGVSKIMLFLD